MKINLRHTEVHLHSQEYVQLVDAKGSRIVCHRGRIWITQALDGRDIVLDTGGAFTLDRNGVAIVQALAFAEIALDAPSRRRRQAASRGAIRASPLIPGFAGRHAAPRLPGRLLPVIERIKHITALAVLGFARRPALPAGPRQTQGCN